MARRERMLEMWKHVEENDVDYWASTFLNQLKEARQ